MTKTITLSGWGQPHDALSLLAPEATPVDYARHDSIDGALAEIAEQGRDADHAIGWSLGGQLAARAVAAGMLKLKTLVLIATPYQFVATREQPLGMKRDLFDKFHANVAQHPARALHKAWELIVKGDSHAERVRGYLARQDKPAVLQKNWKRWLELLDGFSFENTSLAHLPPTLLVHGRQDAVVEAAQSARFADAIPQAKQIVLDDAGHAPHWHDTETVKDFIREHQHV